MGFFDFDGTQAGEVIKNGPKIKKDYYFLKLRKKNQIKIARGIEKMLIEKKI